MDKKYNDNAESQQKNEERPTNINGFENTMQSRKEPQFKPTQNNLNNNKLDVKSADLVPPPIQPMLPFRSLSAKSSGFPIDFICKIQSFF